MVTAMSSNAIEREINDLLRRHKFALVSQHKHYKFQSPENRVFIMSKTPSDWRVWRNALAELKRVIAAPVPTSLLLEEERQRREMEQFISLRTQERQKRGTQGPAKTNGTGIYYYDKPAEEDKLTMFVPDEVRLAEEQKRIDQKWDAFKNHLRTQITKAQKELEDAYLLALTIVSIKQARDEAAEFLRKLRESPVELPKEEIEKWAAIQKDQQARKELIDAWLDRAYESAKEFNNLANCGEQILDAFMNATLDGVVFVPQDDKDEDENEKASFTRQHMVNAMNIWLGAGLAPKWTVQASGDLGLEHRYLRRLFTRATRIPRFKKFASILSECRCPWCRAAEEWGEVFYKKAEPEAISQPPVAADGAADSATPGEAA